jgi:DNA-binding transcriptional MerR regulator
MHPMARKRAGGRAIKVHHLTPASLAVGSPELGAPTLTVGGIAEQLRTLAPDTEASIERIRHWTREGLITPVKKPHAGTGKHREYDALSVLDAAILTVIADAGLHIAAHKYLLDGLAQVRGAFEKWKVAEGGDDLFLEISQTKVGKPFIAVHEGSDILNSTARLTILINLTQILLEIGKGKNVEDAEFQTIERITTTNKRSAANTQEIETKRVSARDRGENGAGDKK